MENRLFLNCSLYTEEKSIPLYSESPLLKAPNVEDDLIIYEDAQYFEILNLKKIVEVYHSLFYCNAI